MAASDSLIFFTGGQVDNGVHVATQDLERLESRTFTR